MIRTTKRPVRSKWAAMRKRPQNARNDERGLTTLEWLLIVAAVAGLAALAVVLVSSVVSDTSEQIAGSSARLTAAHLAGRNVTNKARVDVPDTEFLTEAGFDSQQIDHEERCERLEIVYSDIEGLEAKWKYLKPAAFTATTWAEAFDEPETEGCLVTKT